MVALTETDGDGPICASEGCSNGGVLNLSPPSQEKPVTIEPPARARYSVAQAKESMRETLDNIAQSAAADQVRGLANQAMGKTKLTLGMVTQSPDLTFSGLAQIVVGEFQKSIGEAKLTEDGKDVFPGL
ncbi:hypothetical protein [Methylocystis sp.]|uniref:hypothetical protein n=1 Tax=Methylocystis sp. TaxID=1911079 RepID=UPI0025E2C2E2|nr:hypothetical protein [Methylocystis sp.]